MSKEKEQKKANNHRVKRPLSPSAPLPKKTAQAEFVPTGIAYRETAGGGGMRGLRQTAVLALFILPG